MSATALVVGTDPSKRRQLIDSLADTELFEKVKPLKSASALFQHLKNKSVDIICWAIDREDARAEWVNKLHSHEQWHDLPLIAFADDQQSLVNGLKLGASDSIKLSADSTELSARLLGHLKRWRRILDLRQSKEQLQKMALTDALTGIGNRATFDLSIKQSVARAQRSGSPCSLLMIDLDHFKWFNDCYGHQAGDKVLVRVANAIEESARNSDICCRYGGEEFAVILPDTDADSAQILANRIHQQVARASRQLRLNRMPITVSIGISCADNRTPAHPAGLIEEADRALYQAKKNGRNRTETWHPTIIQPRTTNMVCMPAPQMAFGT